MLTGVSQLRALLRNKRTIYSLFIIPLLAIVLLAGTLTLYHYNFARAASADTLVSFPGTVPPAVAHSKLVGQANPQQTISLSIGLRLRNADALKSYVADITRPKSANYHRYLTVAQIQGAFSPSIASHNAVLQYLRSSGFTITHTYNHRMLVTFRGTVGLAEQIFQVTINNYTAPGGQAFYSNAADPQVPASLAGLIQSISGLNNFQRWHHASVQTHALTGHASKTPSVTCLGHGSNYYTPDQIQAAYNLNGLYGKGFHGEGQTVALFELDTFQSSDLSAYESCFGHSHTTIQTIKAGSGTVPSDGGIVEAELDAELVLSTAPSLGTLVIYEAANDNNDYNAEWARIVQDAPPVVSTSWGSCENDAGQQEASQENSFFSIAAAQGQSIFAASGDSGSSGCYFDQGSPTPKVLNAGDPAAQPLVTGVGGTTLTINGDSTYNKETTWNNPPTQTQSGGATGGGASVFWSKPTWQNAPGVGAGNRESPDVSLNADPNKGYLIYCTATAAQCPNSGWIIVGGTSAAAPMWAAMMALVNEELVRAGSFNIGSLNPLLYQVASGANYGTDFHDVITGNNDYNNLQGGKYAAGPVYDMATGLGSFNADALATDLVTLAKANNGQRLSPVAKTWYFPEGSEGGGFLEYVTLQNPDPTLTATVTFSYLSSNAAPVVVTHSVAPSSRQTFDAQADLKTTPPGTGYHDGVIIQVTSGPGIVAERPIYFIWSGYNSGIDVVGATHTSMTYYFSEADTTQAGSANYKTYVAMINPSQTLPAKVTLTYYTGSCTTTCPTEQVTINPMSRQSVSPTDKGIHGKVAIAVTSDNPIVAERPMYFSNYIARAGGQTTGAASVIGATSPGNDWLFAEGYTGGGFQEYLELANFGTVAANVNIKLEYTDASTQNFTVPVAAGGNVQFDVNAVQNGHPNSLSAEVTSNNPIVAQRLMYFHFGPSHISGGTDIVGETGPASHNVYSFAEGYTGGSFNEFLSVQNPTGNQETISVTLFTKSVVFQLQAVVAAHSRKTFSINGILNPINGGSVSMTVQAIGSNTFIVSERPMYFIYSISGISGTINGGTDVLGYTGA